jgi:hypothetical protein
MKLCIAIFFMVYVNHVSASPKKLGRDPANIIAELSQPKDAYHLAALTKLL